MDKQRYLDAAQVFDQWRVVPRIVLFTYGGWVAHVTDKTLMWYQNLPGAERTLEASGLAAGIITAVTGLFPWIYRIYADTANDWNVPARTTTVSTSSTEITK